MTRRIIMPTGIPRKDPKRREDNRPVELANIKQPV
jgi:hypothetical protein